MSLVNVDFGSGPQETWQNDDGSYWGYDNQRSSFDPENIRPDLRQAELQRRDDLLKPPTTLKEAREREYFGRDLANYPDADNFISQLFQSKGLNEQQAVQAAIQGKAAHQAQFGQSYDTASSLSGIFNDFIFPAAGVAPDQNLETLPGWSRHDAEARGKRAADIEHGGDFGSATGLGQILSYQSNLGGNLAEAYKQDPERALLGINTPLESSAWGAVTGKDYKPTVDMSGGSTSYDTQSAQAKGIDTQSGEQMQDVAKFLAMRFGGGAINGALADSGNTLGSSGGSSSLIGNAGNDTLSTGDSGNLALSNSAPGLNEGTGMWDWLDGIDSGTGFDPGSSSMYNAPISEDTSTGAFDQFGMNNPNTGFQDQGFDPGGTSALDNLKQYGQKGLDLFNKLKSIPGLAGILGKASGAAGGAGGSTGGGILGNILNDPLGAAFNATPFLLSLNEANKQSGDLNDVIGKINSDSYRKSVLDPFDMETGQGRAAMESDLGQRGVAGSSFGYQAMNNYDYSRNLARSDMASKADLASAGLQGQLINQRNTNRNLLLGAGLNASGRLFAPQTDPFDLKKLLGM